MPTYDYECQKCGHTFEAFQAMSDEPLKRCPECRGKLKRLVGAGAGLLFKGSGFYITDYRSSDYQAKSKSETPGSSGPTEAGGASEGSSAATGSAPPTPAPPKPAAAAKPAAGARKSRKKSGTD